MSKRWSGAVSMLFIGIMLSGCSSNPVQTLKAEKPFANIQTNADINDAEAAKDIPTPSAPDPVIRSTVPDKETIINRYRNVHPLKWGENVPGVRTHLQTPDKVIALTFDACGGKDGSGYDQKLIDFLIEQKIPATLFINARWIDANPETFLTLAHSPLFEIENHGYEHRPLSVTGQSAYGIRGTRSAAEVVDEVQMNEDKIEKLTGRRPLFFRAGTAYYDDVAVHVAQDIGLNVVNYNILGDAGATYNTEQVYQAFIKAKSGSIIISHMNHPEKDTAEGVIKAVPVLKKTGFRFVQISDYPLVGK